MLTGEKVILRPIKAEDWGKTFKWRNDLFIKVSTMAHPFPITEELEKKWYEEQLTSKTNTVIPFTAMLKNNSEPVGYFSLNNINYINRNAFFSAVIGEREMIGKGIGREAIDLLIKYGFNYLNLNKICCYVIADHPAVKTYKELGGKEEGLLKKHFFSESKYIDVLILSWFK
jgi:RimJ/RimL family protein N-acetyltransferase